MKQEAGRDPRFAAFLLLAGLILLFHFGSLFLPRRAYRAAVPPAPHAPFPLDINRARPGRLVLVPGIGERLSKRIVEERKKRGGFRDLYELLDIRGIGPAKLERLKGFLTVGPLPPVAEKDRIEGE